MWEWTDSCWRDGAAEGGDRAPKSCGGVRILAGKHKTWQSEFIRHVPVGGCSIGYPPANLGFRVVLDDEPATARHGILQTLLLRLRTQTV